MKFMALDLEMNQPTGEIIQVGAVVFNTKGKVFSEINEYVKTPNPITPRIVELTGITDQIIAEKGRPLAGVYEQLSKIHKNQGCFINPVVWGGGDSVYLHDQSGSKEPNFFGYRIIDVKTIYQAIMVSKGLALKGGLVSSMSKMGVDFIGTPHNAYYDALNTARFYLHILKKLGSI